MTEALQQRARTETMTAAKLGPLAVETFTTARDMARLGVSPGVATEVLSQAIQHRYSAAEMQMMRKSFSNQSRQASPNTLAERYAQGIRGGTTAEGLGAYGTGGGSGGYGGGGARRKRCQEEAVQAAGRWRWRRTPLRNYLQSR